MNKFLMVIAVALALSAYGAPVTEANSVDTEVSISDDGTVITKAE